MFLRYFRLPLLIACSVLLPLNASAALILTISNPNIVGLPLDQITLSGSLQASGGTVSLVPSSPPWSITSSALNVISLLTPAGLSLPDGGSYNGPIALVQIDGAASGLYPLNSFAISFDDDNGRRGMSNSVNLSVDAQAVPEAQTAVLFMSGLAALVLCRSRRRDFRSRLPRR